MAGRILERDSERQVYGLDASGKVVRGKRTAGATATRAPKMGKVESK
jgi:hypothetical protein